MTKRVKTQVVRLCLVDYNFVVEIGLLMTKGGYMRERSVWGVQKESAHQYSHKKHGSMAGRLVGGIVSLGSFSILFA